MTVRRLGALGSILLPITFTTAAIAVDRTGPIDVAQAPPGKSEAPLTEEESKKLEQQRQKGQENVAPKEQPQPPSKASPPPPPSPPPKAAAPPALPKAVPPPTTAPPLPRPKAEPNPSQPPQATPSQPNPPKPTPPPPAPPVEKKGLPTGKEQPPAEKKSLSPTPPPASSGVAAGLPKDVGPVLEGKKDSPKGATPTQPGPADKSRPPGLPKAPSPTAGPPQGVPPAASDVPTGLPKDGGPIPEGKKDSPKGATPAQPGAGTRPPTVSGGPPQFQRGPQTAAPPLRFDQVQKGREERVEDGGRRTVIQEPGPGNRVIVKQDNRVIIQHDDSERFRRLRDAQTERHRDGRVETFYVRPDGVRVISEVDANGRLMRRYRRGPDGREHHIIDNRRFLRDVGIGIGVGAIGVAIALNLPHPAVAIPRERYIVEYERASNDELDEALSAPPVHRLERAYSLEEIRYSYQLREHMRRVDLDAINFQFGAFEVTPDQYGRLEGIARAIMRVLARNSDEVFLIEGHTDAVGSDVDNLSLSDRRAEAVAQTLTETFGVAPENLVTQGYGKQFLKIDTPAPERANRRVAVRRITPLMSER